MKFSKSRQLILSKGFHITFTEKWLTYITCKNELFVPGFQVYRRDLGGSGGGRVVGVPDAVKLCLFICGNPVNEY